ncbi:O-antigen ligase family protein [Desulfomicrobium apsheronum]|uniref:O-antigen ligase family protein n=1 Tax=Desulfomicrobium apsheronum TaxID=52560 RepID=UPI0015A6E936|nr:O-antigen ligase family protein [Desulfomicrobium apsheronum]
MIVSAVMLGKSSNLRQFLWDSSLLSLLTFGLYCSFINIIGPGDVARTGIIYGWIIPLVLGKAFILFRHQTVQKDILAAALALAGVMLVAQLLLAFDIKHIDNLGLDLQYLKLTFRNVSRTALFVAVGCMVCFTQFIFASSYRSRLLTMTAGIILLSALLVTERRMTLAALLICCGFLLASRRSFRAIVLGLAAIVCIIFLFGKAERFDLRPGHLLASQGERLTVWYAAVEIIKTHPLTGSGFRTFKEAAAPHVETYRASHPKEGAYENLEDAHNLPLHLLSENGIIGMAIFSLIFFFPLRNCWQLRSTNPAAIPLLSSIALILLNSQLHVNIFSLNVSGLLFLLVGAASGIGEEHRR